jgi:ketosteroid isomerase-like protein
MATTALEKELIALERSYWQALKDQDVDAALRMTSDPCIVTGAQGVGKIDKSGFAAMMQNATWQLNDFALSDIQVEQLGDDVAIVAYRVREELSVDGAPLTLEAADASTWVRRDGSWLCALHTEALLGDPFGRDRQAPTA